MRSLLYLPGLWILLVAGQHVAAAAPARPAARSAKAKASPWLSLQDGLARLRQKQIPAIIVLDIPGGGEGQAEGGAPGEPPPARARSSRRAVSFRQRLEESSMRTALRRFACVLLAPEDLRKPYPSVEGGAAGRKGRGEDAKEKKGAKGGGNVPAPRAGQARGGKAPTIGSRLSLTGKRPSLLVLSFREDVVLRRDREVPTGYRLRKELGRIFKVNEILARQARVVDKAVRDSRYAAGLGKQRDAVLIIRPFEDARAQSKMDAVSKAQVQKLVQQYRAEARKAIAAADKLDVGREYGKAIKAFDRVMADYPFKDIMQHANRRKGEILRKVTYGF